MSAGESRGENILALRMEKNRFLICHVTKLLVRRFLWTFPPPPVWFQNHQIWGFQTKLTFDLNSIFEKFEIKIKFENCCILKERKNCSMTLCWHLNWKSFKCFRMGADCPFHLFFKILIWLKARSNLASHQDHNRCTRSFHSENGRCLICILGSGKFKRRSRVC